MFSVESAPGQCACDKPDCPHEIPTRKNFSDKGDAQEFFNDCYAENIWISKIFYIHL